MIVCLGHLPRRGHALDIGGATELGNLLTRRVTRNHRLGIARDGELRGIHDGVVEADARKYGGGHDLGGGELVELRIGHAERIQVKGCEDVVDVAAGIQPEGDAGERLTIRAHEPAVARSRHVGQARVRGANRLGIERDGVATCLRRGLGGHAEVADEVGDAVGIDRLELRGVCTGRGSLQHVGIRLLDIGRRTVAPDEQADDGDEDEQDDDEEDEQVAQAPPATSRTFGGSLLVIVILDVFDCLLRIDGDGLGRLVEVCAFCKPFAFAALDDDIVDVDDGIR